MKDASNSIKKKKRIGMYVVLLFDFNQKVFLKKFFFLWPSAPGNTPYEICLC